MCGIVGCILKKDENVAPILYKCISNLEYRGYDSVGLATYDNKTNVKKAKGKIKEVNNALNFEIMPGLTSLSQEITFARMVFCILLTKSFCVFVKSILI